MNILNASISHSALPRALRWSRALLAGCAIALTATSAFAAPSATVVISQVYGAGGNTGATYNSDFIELHNISSSAVSLSGWSIQYASATATAWTNITPLTGSIPAGGYYLIKQNGGANGLPLPTPDATGTLLMAAGAGKVGLATTTTALTGSKPTNVVDFVGYGTTANGFEGSGPTPAPSATLSVSRTDSGSLDTDNNATDFLAAIPAPRNSATPPYNPVVTVPPAITSLSPADNSTGALNDANLVMTFNKVVLAGTGNIIITTSDDSSIFATIPIGDPQIMITGGTVTINPTANLQKGIPYHVQVSATAIKDSSGQFFAGISNTTTWSFTTLADDFTAPTVVSFTPANGATGITPPSSLQINFNESVQLPFSSDPVRKVTVKKSDGTTVGTINADFFGDGISVTGAVATITIPSASALDFGVSYYVEVDAGAFEDTSGNPFAGISGSMTWAFTTAEVPSLGTSPYSQNFATYNSAATLPLGWSAKGGPGYLSGYEGNWGSISQGGFRGNAGVFGYHHTSQSLTFNAALEQILTLRNMTGAVITDLTVTYKGRVAVPENTRLPFYTVSVAGVATPSLSYTTSDPDNSQRKASIGGLTIAAGATFQIKWSSSYPAGSGSARQIGISDVFVNAGSTSFPPSVAGLNIPVAMINATTATAQAEVIGNGGQTLTASGFVYSKTSDNAAPEIGGAGVTTFAEGSSAVGALSTIMTGLTPETSYTVRAYASNSSGTSYTGSKVFITLGNPPTLVSSYTQNFVVYTGANPAGWTSLSDAATPIQNYAGAWGTTASTGGFLGGDSNPGVLGYRHTGSTGNLTVTLRLINGIGAPINTLHVSYLGRVQDTEEGRSPAWAVSVNGSDPISALAYSTSALVDQTKTTILEGLNIAAGQEFSISWKSSRGEGSNSSKQIGISGVYVGLRAPAAGNTFANWSTTNAGGQGSTGDFDKDGVPNGVEYFCGETGSSFTANPQIVAGTISFPYDSTVTGVTYKVMSSTNLTTWTDVTAGSVVQNGFVKYTLPTGQGKIFVRLEVAVAAN